MARIDDIEVELTIVTMSVMSSFTPQIEGQLP